MRCALLGDRGHWMRIGACNTDVVSQNWGPPKLPTSGLARAALLTLHRDREDYSGTPLGMHPDEASDWRRAPDNEADNDHR